MLLFILNHDRGPTFALDDGACLALGLAKYVSPQDRRAHGHVIGDDRSGGKVRPAHLDGDRRHLSGEPPLLVSERAAAQLPEPAKIFTQGLFTCPALGSAAVFHRAPGSISRPWPTLSSWINAGNPSDGSPSL